MFEKYEIYYLLYLKIQYQLKFKLKSQRLSYIIQNFT